VAQVVLLCPVACASVFWFSQFRKVNTLSMCLQVKAQDIVGSMKADKQNLTCCFRPPASAQLLEAGTFPPTDDAATGTMHDQQCVHITVYNERFDVQLEFANIEWPNSSIHAEKH